ncbi:BglG family transcription antiterminator [Olsenella sp. Marseille-P4559]|uniref:BglG family transcription antiterminator n=1 Tax=Olsenella sp. Marseille-P4559 TaxID=2364795 RepID=UPI001031AC28|nr:HTH domain-containing protein [Olsenella sp. Marseille-P4559]
MRQMNARSWDILRCLMDNPFSAVTAQQLSRKLGISERTVRYEVAALSDWLGERGIVLERVPRRGFSIAMQDVARAAELVSQSNGVPDAKSVCLSGEQRMYAIVSGLLDETCPSTAADIACALGVSRTTALRDMERVAGWLRAHGVGLLDAPQGGWALDVSEYRRRQVMSDFVGEGFGVYANLFSVQGDASDCSVCERGFACEGELKRMAFALDRYLDDVGESLTDSAYVQLTYYLNATRIRTRQGHYVSGLPAELDAVTDEARASLVSLFDGAGAVAEGESLDREVDALGAMLLAAPKMRVDASGGIRTGAAERVVGRLVSVISEKIGYDLYLDEELVDGLRIHVQALLARERLGIQARCDLLPSVRGRFPDLFSICRGALLAAQGEYGLTASDDEVGFVVMYVGAALERLRQNPAANRSVRAVLVCGAGMGTVAFLSRSLAKEFSHLEIVAKLSARDCRLFDYSDVDVVLTTVELPGALPKPTIRVTPMLSRVDIRKIEAFLHSPVGLHGESEIVDDLLGLVRTTCDIKDAAALERGIRDIVGERQTAGAPALPGLLSLDELVSEEFTQVGIASSSWEDAVAKASGPLLDAGWMTEDYYRAILGVAADYEQYGVILAPLCAPHAEPDGRNRPGVSVVTLRDRVKVSIGGDEVPIGIVMVLCLQTPIAHARALDELFSLVDEHPGFVPALESARSPAALVKLVSDYCRRIRC